MKEISIYVISLDVVLLVTWISGYKWHGLHFFFYLAKITCCLLSFILSIFACFILPINYPSLSHSSIYPFSAHLNKAVLLDITQVSRFTALKWQIKEEEKYVFISSECLPLCISRMIKFSQKKKVLRLFVNDVWEM